MEYLEGGSQGGESNALAANSRRDSAILRIDPGSSCGTGRMGLMALMEFVPFTKPLMKTPRLFLLFLVLFTQIPAELCAAEPAKDLASVVQPFVDRHELAGAVMLVASKDKVLDLEFFDLPK